MKQILYLVFLLIFLVSCSVKPPEIQVNYSLDSYNNKQEHLETWKISSFKIEGRDLIFTNEFGTTIRYTITNNIYVIINDYPDNTEWFLMIEGKRGIYKNK